MLPSNKRIQGRDILLVAAGAFSFFFISQFTLKDPGSSLHLLQHNANDNAYPNGNGNRINVHHDDLGYYEDWSMPGELDSPAGSIPDPILPMAPTTEDNSEKQRPSQQLGITTRLKSTKVVNHAPGWTMFENLYMSNGTLFIVTSPEDQQMNADGGNGMFRDGWENGFPLRRMMTSTGLPGYANEQSIRDREPTDKDMMFISKEDAVQRWGDRIWEVEGKTWLFNDPNQFLGHFYHFVAELLFGVWAFYAGTQDPFISARGETTVLPPSRAIFLRCSPTDIRDSSKFNTYYMKAAFPSVALETSSDWADRIYMTRNADRAWVFPHVTFTDRSASFRGRECGTINQRIAAEAYSVVRDRTTQWWWEPVRRAVLRYAGVPEKVIDININSPARFSNHLSPPVAETESPIVITYIDRQGGRRSLRDEDHERLVQELSSLAQRRGWEFHDIKAQLLTQEEQLAIAAKTTIMVGVHGNGLSHLLSMPPTKLSTVVEIFNNPGYTFDYGWPARTLGFKHYAVWNDTAMVYPDAAIPNTPEDSFHANNIPVYGPYIANIIEERVDTAMEILSAS